MKIIAISFGVLLIVLGLGGFMATGATTLTALTPALFGLVICVLGLIQRPEKGSKNFAFFGVVFLAILGFVGSIRGVINLYISLTGGQVAAPGVAVQQALMAGLCLIFVLLAIVLTPNFWQGWKAFGHFLGNQIARVVLTFFYFTVFMPFALGTKWFSDPLHLKTTPAKLWQSRITGDQSLEEVLRQF
jgi:hypothetical protein